MKNLVIKISDNYYRAAMEYKFEAPVAIIEAIRHGIIIPETMQHENEMLKNRCAALTDGTMCMFCPFECDRRAARFRGEKEGKNGNDD